MLFHSTVWGARLLSPRPGSAERGRRRCRIGCPSPVRSARTRTAPASTLVGRKKTVCVDTFKGTDYKLGVYDCFGPTGPASLLVDPPAAETTYATDTKQCMTEGNSTAHTHYVWSHYGNPQNVDNTALHVLFSS